MARLKLPASQWQRALPRLKPLPKVADAFYSSREWRTLVRAIRRGRGATCKLCGSSERVIADHIVEIKDGGALLDPGNIQLLCHACHQAKTAHARRRRAETRT